MKLTFKNNGSRRDFFQKTAVLFGAGAMATQLVGQTTGTGTGTTAAPTDLDVLQYALALENLEAAFYNQGVARFGATDFANGAFAANFGSKITANVYTYLQAIRDHENAHVAAISAVIKQLGGTPNPACTYKFTYNTTDEFLMVAMALENTGVSAYDGAIGLLSNPDIIQAGATIATVEARHAAYLNILNGAIPFPSAFDQPRTMADILAVASQFIVSCPVPVTPPPTTNPNAPTLSGVPTTINTRNNTFTFDASSSVSKNGQAVSFSVTKMTGGNVSIVGGNTATPSVTILGGTGTYTFLVTITDLAGNMTQKLVTVNYTA